MRSTSRHELRRALGCPSLAPHFCAAARVGESRTRRARQWRGEVGPLRASKNPNESLISANAMSIPMELQVVYQFRFSCGTLDEVAVSSLDPSPLKMI